ncbi:MAG: hypothetical protein ACK5LC_05680 [Coprobacillaceae bacterium]
MIDNNIKTTFTTTSDEGHINYTYTENTTASELIILQNAQNISDAKVNIRTTDGWHEIGNLSQAVNIFDLTTYRDLLELKLEWVDNGVVPQINEIYTTTSEVDKSPLSNTITTANDFLENVDPNSKQYSTITEALLSGTAVMNTSFVSRGMIIDAATKINNALTSDKRALQELIDACLVLKESDYTSQT